MSAALIGEIFTGIEMMKRFAITITVLFLIGCQSVDSSQIPLDTVMIKTEAVRTAIAEMTVQAILNPTPLMATVISSPIPNNSGEETTETLTPTREEIKIEVTAAPVEPIYVCAIDLAASLPKDGPQPAGEKVEKTWVIWNSGNVAWTSENVRSSG